MQDPSWKTLPPQNVTVLSAGAWGAPLALLLAGKGHRVTAWDLPQVIAGIRESGSHPRLPGVVLPDNLRFSDDLAEALGAPTPDCVVATTPCQLLRSMVERCRDLAPRTGDSPAWVLCMKGIEEGTLMTASDVVESVRGADWRQRIAVLSGPCLAPEVARNRPTSVCVAAYERDLGLYAQDLFMTDRFRVYTQDDVVGVELGGALKNVIAIAAGVCDGLDLGENARAALITRGLAEMVRLGIAMGGNPSTFSGLAGMGDLIVTCASKISRNHRFGEALARGLTCRQALDEIGMAVEGMPTARSAWALAQKHQVPMPITQQVYALIYEGKRPAEAVSDLMLRDARSERD